MLNIDDEKTVLENTSSSMPSSSTPNPLLLQEEYIIQKVYSEEQLKKISLFSLNNVNDLIKEDFLKISRNGNVSFKTYIRRNEFIRTMLNNGLILLSDVQMIWNLTVKKEEKKEKKEEKEECDLVQFKELQKAILSFIENNPLELVNDDSPEKKKKKEEEKEVIVIRASDVAACVGFNQFKSPEDVLVEMIESYAPHLLVQEGFISATAELKNVLIKDKSGETLEILNSAVKRCFFAHKIFLLGTFYCLFI